MDQKIYTYIYSNLLVFFIFTDSPPYTKRLCCTKPELTVYMSGTIKNASNGDLEDWLRKIVSPPICFEHIVKRDPNMWGHVHFRTHDFASKFYYAMEGKTFSGKLKDSTQFEVRFSKATYYKSGKTVDYVIETVSFQN